jgi:hypothetical protein
MKYLATLILLFLSTTWINAQVQFKNPDVPFFDLISSMDLIHIVKPSNSDSIIKIVRNQIIGQVAPYPDKFSETFDNEIRLSIKSYESGDFLNAKKILEDPIMIEPNNAFILFNYARASYNVDKPKSYEVYKKLVSLLDSRYHSVISAPVIDLWFREAYWKLGTLYMDNKVWSNAYYEISRFILSIQESKWTPVYSQAMEFLTECAYNLNDNNLSYYLAQRTLWYDPNNQYAKSILIKTNK